MSGEPMELAKNWDEKHYKKVLPAYAQIKYDGVPLTFVRLLKDTDYQIVGKEEYTTFAGGTVVALTRQNEAAASVPHLLRIADLLLLTPGANFTAECFVPGKPFKDSSGIIRRTVPDLDTAGIRAVIFDASLFNRDRDPYFTRIAQLHEALAPLNGHGFAAAPQKLVSTVEEVAVMWETLLAMTKATGGGTLEGMMLHSLSKPRQPGKRCWGMARFKPQPVIDLIVDSFEEATSEAGEPLGMIGRVNVQLLRKWPSSPPARKKRTDLEWLPTDVPGVFSAVVGVGPGKLDHEDRKGWWNDYNMGALSNKTVMASIKFMPDESYGALRQPTVQLLRTDKTESDVLDYSEE